MPFSNRKLDGVAIAATTYTVCSSRQAYSQQINALIPGMSPNCDYVLQFTAGFFVLCMCNVAGTIVLEKLKFGLLVTIRICIETACNALLQPESIIP